MKVAAVLIASLIALMQTNGCDEPTKPVTPNSTAKEPRLPPLHRFVNVSSPASPGIALDTVTGQYCRTWEWSYKVASMNGGLDTVPTCLRVFQSIPAGEDPKDPLGILPSDPKQ